MESVGAPEEKHLALLALPQSQGFKCAPTPRHVSYLLQTVEEGMMVTSPILPEV